MIDSLNVLDDIRDIFAILHDGRTSTWTGDKNLLLLKVECKYLAQRIDKSYKNFYVEFGQIEKIEMHLWMNPFELPKVVFTDIQAIFQTSLEILSTDIVDDFVKIDCNQHDRSFDYCGGNLLINAKTIKILDEGNHQLTIDEFGEICKSYWDECSKELERSILERKGQSQ